MSYNVDRNGDRVPLANPVYDDGRTKQSFKDETDINKILKRAQKTGTISHMNRYGGTYSDFSEYDFGENMQKLAEGRQIFDDLPLELRREFENNPANFFEYVNDPVNKDDLLKKLPALAAPGAQNLDVRGNITADEAKKAAEAALPPPLPEIEATSEAAPRPAEAPTPDPPA